MHNIKLKQKYGLSLPDIRCIPIWLSRPKADMADISAERTARDEGRINFMNILKAGHCDLSINVVNNAKTLDQLQKWCRVFIESLAIYLDVHKQITPVDSSLQPVARRKPVIPTLFTSVSDKAHILTTLNDAWYEE